MFCSSFVVSVALVRYTALGLILQMFCLLGTWGLLQTKLKGEVDLFLAFLVIVLPLTVLVWGVDLDKFVPNPIFGMADKMPAVVMTLCFGILAASRVLSGHTRRTGHRVDYQPPVFLFLLYLLVNLLCIYAAPPSLGGVAEGVRVPDTLREAIPTIIGVPVFFYAGFHLIRDEKQSALLMNALVFLAALVTLSACVEFIDRDLYYRIIRPFAPHPEDRAFDPWSMRQMTSIIGWQTTFCGFILVTLPGCWLLWSRTDRRISRVIYLGLAVFLLIGIILANIRAGAVAALAEVIILLVLDRRKKASTLFFVILVCLAALAFAVFLSLFPRFEQGNLLHRFTDEGLTTVGRRLEIVEMNLAEVFPRYPWLGVGPGRFALFNPVVEYRPVGYTAHNFLLNRLIETGLLGFSVFTGLLLVTLRPSFSSTKKLAPVESRTALTVSAVGLLTFGLSVNVFDVQNFPLVALFWLQRGVAWSLDSRVGRFEEHGEKDEKHDTHSGYSM